MAAKRRRKTTKPKAKASKPRATKAKTATLADCAKKGGRRRCVPAGYRVHKIKKASAKNKCIASAMRGKKYGTQAAARNAFSSAVAKCSGKAPKATRKRK